MREIFDYADVVRNEEVTDAQALLQVFQQIENLRLHRHIEGAGRFVTHDQPGVDCQRARNRDALALPAGKLMRIFVTVVTAQANLIEQFNHACNALHACLANAERTHALGDDVANAHARVERRERILKHDLGGSARAAQCLAFECGQFLPFKPDGPASDANQLQQAFAHRRLATTRLADQRQRAPGCNVERHAINRFDLPHHALEQALADREMYFQIPDGQKALCTKGFRLHSA